MNPTHLQRLGLARLEVSQRLQAIHQAVAALPADFDPPTMAYATSEVRNAVERLDMAIAQLDPNQP